MKTLIIAASLACCVASFGITVPSQAAPLPKVDICHYPGHDANVSLQGGTITGDFFFADPPAFIPPDDVVEACLANRGHIINVSCNAASAHVGAECP